MARTLNDGSVKRWGGGGEEEGSWRCCMGEGGGGGSCRFGRGLVGGRRGGGWFLRTKQKTEDSMGSLRQVYGEKASIVRPILTLA
jgi:hypothetical protein